MLPHIRYTELKFTSDADTEIQEDDSTFNGIIPENQGTHNFPNLKFSIWCVQKERLWKQGKGALNCNGQGVQFYTLICPRKYSFPISDERKLE